jgi:hypothetical protein
LIDHLHYYVDYYVARDDDTPLFSTLKNVIGQSMFAEYLERRDTSYHEGMQCYRGNSYKFACTSWEAMKAPTQTRAAIIRRVFDKLLSPGNILKHDMATQDNALPTHCLLCGYEDDSSHATLKCTHPEQLEIRHHAYAKLDIYLHNLTAAEGFSLQLSFATTLHNMIRGHSSRWNIWLGLWNDDLLRDLRDTLPTFPNDVHLTNSFRKIAISMTKILVSAVTASTKLQSQCLRAYLTHHKRPTHFLSPPTPDSSQAPSLLPQISHTHYLTPVSFDSLPLSAPLPTRHSWTSQGSSLPRSSSSASSLASSSISTFTPISAHLQHTSSIPSVYTQASLASKRRFHKRKSLVARVSSAPITKFFPILRPPSTPSIIVHSPVLSTTPRPGPEIAPIQQSTAIT